MKTFLGHRAPLVTPILMSNTKAALLTEIRDSEAEGADAFLLPLERLSKELRTESSLKCLISEMHDKPVCVTCYARGDAVTETDDERARTLLLALRCGATMADVRGDMFFPCEGEMTYDKEAVQRQTELIAEIHALGKQALVSSHNIIGGTEAAPIFGFLKKEEAVTVAKQQQERGADIAKIVARAETEQELSEAFETILCLKREVKIPSLFLCVGKKCLRHRLGGGLLFEPIVFAKEKRYVEVGSPQPSIEVLKSLFLVSEVNYF